MLKKYEQKHNNDNMKSKLRDLKTSDFQLELAHLKKSRKF